ncbi:hypothetical protein ACHAWF_012371 [Thalassiosira exigua]
MTTNALASPSPGLGPEWMRSWDTCQWDSTMNAKKFLIGANASARPSADLLLPALLLLRCGTNCYSDDERRGRGGWARSQRRRRVAFPSGAQSKIENETKMRDACILLLSSRFLQSFDYDTLFTLERKLPPKSDGL